MKTCFRLTCVLFTLIGLWSVAASANPQTAKARPGGGDAPKKQTTSAVPAAEQNQSVKNAATAKKPGVIRFGIVGAGGQSIPDAQVQAANARLVEMLGGETEDSGFEAILLQGKLDVMIQKEAKNKGCDYVLFVKELNSSIGSTPSGGGNPFNALRDTAKKAIEIAPNSALKSTKTSEAQTKVDKTADLLNSVSKTTKKKDKVGLKFSLMAVGNNTEIIADTLKEKVASKDGEDVLGSVLVEVGNLVLNAVAKR